MTSLGNLTVMFAAFLFAATGALYIGEALVEAIADFMAKRRP